LRLEDQTAVGEGGPFVADGNIRFRGGSIPVNTHGGHLSEAYIIGMTHIAVVPHVSAGIELDGTQGAGARMLANVTDCDPDAASATRSRSGSTGCATASPCRASRPCSWYRIVDTNLPPGLDFAPPAGEVRIDPADHYIASPRSTVVLVGRAIR